MAQPTNTFDSYDSIGNREDLADVIYNISPTETPFLSMCAKTKATNTYHEWQVDELAAAADNKVIEGDDVSGDSVAATTRRGNYTQLSDKAVTIPSTLEAVNRAGRQKEMSYQIAKRAKELKRDMEKALVGLNNPRVAGDGSTARELASVQSWIATNTSKGASGADPTGDGTDARTDGTQRALTEDLLKDVIQDCWTEGGEPGWVMAGAHNRVVMSTFTGGSTRFDGSADEKLYASIRIYVSDFGELKIVPNRYLRTRDCLVLDMNLWAVAYLQPFHRFKLAKTGHTEKEAIAVEYTLESRQQKASGIVADLTTS